MIQAEFDQENGVFYRYSVNEEVVENRLKLAKSTERAAKAYEEITQIGAVPKWGKDEQLNTGWAAGWYEAEVQSVDFDDDEIDISFLEESECVYTVSVLPNLICRKLRLKQNQ